MTTRQILACLQRFESRNVTHIETDGSWPIVWERARGVHVWDADGRKYLDLTAAFGVMAAGHANPRVVRAGQQQMARLLHAMGDVHPHGLKASLARELSRLTFERWSTLRNRPGKPARKPAQSSSTGKSVFCNSGFEAVEVALKTAMLATGRRGVIAFTGAYHGTGYGALSTTHRTHFHEPFRAQLRKFGHFVDFPRAEDPSRPGASETVRQQIAKLGRRHEIGAILVEPVQARGGINIPNPAFLKTLRHLCDQHGWLLIADEIFTGFGRTGKWFACEYSGVVPDLICLGKALTGGFPLSACVGRADVMDRAWPESTGEAIHTSTFLGHPVGCAMALAQISELRRLKLVERSARLGTDLLQMLQSEISDLKSQIRAAPRGLGLMAGVELRRPNRSPATQETLAIVKRMLHRGFILLPEGPHSNVISITPPLTITEAQLRAAVRALGKELRRLS